jgi:hypothetical protein
MGAAFNVIVRGPCVGWVIVQAPSFMMPYDATVQPTAIFSMVTNKTIKIHESRTIGSS